MFNPDKIKKQFPIFSRQIHGHPLVYLDTAATAQKPKQVIDALVDYYSNHNANIHRGVHTLGDESTHMFEHARETVATFLGASSKQLIFTKNTTEAINLIGYSWALNHISSDEVILVSKLEHHSNLLVWQEVVRQAGAKLVVVRVTDDGHVDIPELERYLSGLGERIRILALSHLSNITGSVLPLEEVTELVKRYAPQAKLVLDCAQSAPALMLDFADMKVDALTFSGHKLYGPMGIGGLVVTQSWLKEFRPFMLGGGMIKVVDYQAATYVETPEVFDAGTPNVADTVGLASAVEFLEELSMDQVEQHSRDLVRYSLSRLSDLNNLSIIGPVDPQKRLGSVAFTIDGLNGHDIAQVLDSQGIAVRSGHHCTQPLHLEFGWGASVRASFGVYNSKADVDQLIVGLVKAQEVLRK